MTFSGAVSLVAVLLLHAIGSAGPYTVTPETFAAELGALRAHHVHVLTLPEFERYVSGRLRVAQPSVLLTFDDGNASVFTAATPILKKYHDPATAFLIGARVGTDPSTVTQAEVRAMAATGLWSFGSHTFDLHSPYDTMNNMRYYTVNDLNIAPALSQDETSENALFASLGLPLPNSLAFPFGYYTPDILSQLHATLPYLFTSNTGFAQPGEYLIPRINVGSDFANVGRLNAVIHQMQEPPLPLTADATRAGFVVLLDQALGIAKLSPPLPTFSDVPKGNPYYRYIEAAYAAGFLSGIAPGRFGPDLSITRAEAAKLLVEAYEGGNYTPVLTSTNFKDNAAIPHALVGYVATAVKLRLMRGTLGGRFNPGALLTLSQETHLNEQLQIAVETGGLNQRALKATPAPAN